jgi:UDPglucose 6-dehydrogenase
MTARIAIIGMGHALGGDPSARRHFIDLLQPVLGPARTYFQCTAIEAEIIKYMENAYRATKVTFVTEFRRICETFGADWHTVRGGWLLDPRIEPAHTAAFASTPGFGGKCLPKDLAAIIRAAADAGYSPGLLSEVLHSNQRFRDQGTPWPPARISGGRQPGNHPPASPESPMSADSHRRSQKGP